ncbi:hypothetical protein BU16DRAFT_246560 [Lophium mytilinum]|uniref:Uncharacterized protein n=1 Tax=Lophium mytilinum TaxID=390894 RepID=A0A6A6RAA1_9PEZI|nr:hypothetical protein BU16DRAFT_246560 [Lophium mytilinum]
MPTKHIPASTINFTKTPRWCLCPRVEQPVNPSPHSYSEVARIWHDSYSTLEKHAQAGRNRTSTLCSSECGPSEASGRIQNASSLLCSCFSNLQARTRRDRDTRSESIQRGSPCREARRGKKPSASCDNPC